MQTAMNTRGRLVLICSLILPPLLFPWAAAPERHHDERGRLAPPEGLLVKVSPSKLALRISGMLRQPSNLSASEVIAIGNSRIPVEGVDYEFEVRGLIEKFNLRPIDGDSSQVATYRLPVRSLAGEFVNLEVRVSPEQMCGERLAVIPVARLTPSEVDVVAGGKVYQLRRPQSFSLEGMALVDHTMKKPLRKWELPFVTRPIGISSDGTIVFFRPDFNIYDLSSTRHPRPWHKSPQSLLVVGRRSEKSREMVLEASTGTYRFADVYDLLAKESVELVENHPTFPDDAFAGFMSIGLGDKRYFIRFSWPCT
jgi:hypothetical protein